VFEKDLKPPSVEYKVILYSLSWVMAIKHTLRGDKYDTTKDATNSKQNLVCMDRLD